MSFREKTAWISLGVTALVWGGYFASVWRELAAPDPSSGDILGLFVRAVILTVVLEVALAIAVAVAAPKAANSPADERERLIELRSTRIAYGVLSVGAVTVALASPALAAAGPHLLNDRLDDTVLITANGILLALIAAEVVKSAAQVFAFRRGG
jgi:hypothetical protein